MNKTIAFLLGFLFSTHCIFSQTNWELLNPKPTANAGKQIEFISNTTGYILTNKELLITTDTGITWSVHMPISTGNDLKFKDGIGLIAGNNGYLLKSDDNGVTWNLLQTGTINHFNAINIIDANTYIISTSGSILKSVDGGANWEYTDIPGDQTVTTVFVDALTGHAACHDGTIYKTVNGGNDWYITQSFNFYPANYVTLNFINENIGFASREHSAVYKTIDGGESWEEINTPNDLLYDFSFVDENFGFAVGSYGVIFSTNNGGDSWEWKGFQNGRYYATTMYGVHFLNHEVGFATGLRGRILKTTDGGQNWESYAPMYNSLNNIQIFESGIGYVNAGNDYFKTTDFGQTWEFISESIPNQSIGDSQFINEEVGYSMSSGQISNLYKTTDGAKTWERLPVPSSSNFYAIHFIDENTGFLTYDYSRRRVLKTTDGGQTWIPVYNQHLFDIQFVNEDTGFARTSSSYDGKIYKTTDGGSTWDVDFELEDEEINSLHFIDELNAYFVGDDYTLYKTEDGGENWQSLQGPYGYNKLIRFYNKNLGFIVDDYGKIYKTENGGLSWNYIYSIYEINDLKFFKNEMYIAAENGVIYKSQLDVPLYSMYISEAEDIKNNRATVRGAIGSNGNNITEIEIEYGKNFSFDQSVAVSPSEISGNESVEFSVLLSDLEPETSYQFRLKAVHNGEIIATEYKEFRTNPDFRIETLIKYPRFSFEHELVGKISSFEHEITAIKFEYGLDPDALTNTISGSPSTVAGEQSNFIYATITNLTPDTEYFFRIVAKHEGEDIFGEVQSFTTQPQYKIHFDPPYEFNGKITVPVKIITYAWVLSDLTFEYGTENLENSVAINPSSLGTYRTEYVRIELENLDTDVIYYFRIKGELDGKTVYSATELLNLSGDVIMIPAIERNSEGSLELEGVVNSGKFLTDIQFEYGTTPEMGTFISATPGEAEWFKTTFVKARIDKVFENENYYFRLTAKDLNRKLYTSDMFTFESEGSKKEISVFPVPSNDVIHIEPEINALIEKVEIYNSSGALIIQKTNTNPTGIQIDASAFQKGVYWIQVYFENGKKTSSKILLN